MVLINDRTGECGKEQSRTMELITNGGTIQERTLHGAFFTRAQNGPKQSVSQGLSHSRATSFYIPNRSRRSSPDLQEYVGTPQWDLSYLPQEPPVPLCFRYLHSAFWAISTSSTDFHHYLWGRKGFRHVSKNEQRIKHDDKRQQ
ncbi:unnamed protein product, partial [Nezara viridula]